MTLDSDGLAWIRRFFPRGFYPKNENYEEDEGEWPDDLIESQVFIMDILIYLRGMPRTYIKGGEDDMETEDVSNVNNNNNNEDLVKINTCGDVMESLLAHIKKVLNSENNVKVAILRMDLSGKTPKAKYVGYAKRYDNIKAYEIPEGVADDDVFKDDMELPCTINSIFKSYRAKKLFYRYMTNYILRNFKEIPIGKRLILDGGITEMESDTPLEPIVLYNAGEYQDEYIIQTDRMSEEYYLSHIGEADIGMIFWCNKLNLPPSVIMSEDGDLIIIALLQCRKRITKKGKLDENKIFIRKKKVIGKRKLEDHVIAKKQELRDRLDPENKRKVRNFKLIKQAEYIDIDRLYRNIIDMNLWYGGKCLLDGNSEPIIKNNNVVPACLNPVETLCTLLFMAGNDYVKRLPNVGFTKIWQVFTENATEYALGYMVLIRKRLRRRFPNTESPNLDSDDNIYVHKYGIHWDRFEKFVLLLFRKAFPKCTVKHSATLEDFLEAYPECYKNAKRKVVLPTIGDIRGMAANLAWCLAYFGNSYVEGHKYAYSLTVTEDGYDKHGYKLIDKDKSALYGNITFSGNVKEKDIYWCY